MMSDLGRSVTPTGDPANPYGEMSLQQQAQIASMLGRSQDSTVIGGFTDILGALSGPVGTGMSLAGLLGVPSVSDTDPVTQAVASNYGKGTLSGLFGNYSADPGIQAATESYFAGRTPSTAPPEGPGDYVLRNGLMVPREEAEPAKPGDPDYGIYTPDWRPT